MLTKAFERLVTDSDCAMDSLRMAGSSACIEGIHAYMP